MLTRRGRLVVAFGAAVYLAAWGFGSRPLYPVAAGLLLAVALAALCVRLAARPIGFQRFAGAGEHLEGDDVYVGLELEPTGHVGLVSAQAAERFAGLGEQRAPLRATGRLLRGRYLLASVPRGRYSVEKAYAVFEDPFELERVEVPLPAGAALLVFPRLVDLEGVFSESGARGHGGKRVLLRRPAGFDLHSVREYEEGESLRRVHWRTTARRGQLMVKELEDEPRDELAIVLDADAGAVAGPPGASSFDAAVRAAGSLLKAQVRRGRRAILIVNSVGRESQRVRSDAADWRRALELLAGAQPTGRTGLAALLADENTPAARAVELAIVTSRLDGALVDRLVQRALAHRRVSVVYVDAPTFAGAKPAREPGLLRLAAVGVPVAVLRRGDDLATVLRGAGPAEAAVG
jgi:uncharacterized protein (DUF58 family)